MKINEVNIPENNENGLSEIKMIKLENVVCIAGQNGSGKSRLLKYIKNELTYNKITEISYNDTNRKIFALKEEIKNYLNAIKGTRSKILEIPNNSNNEAKISQEQSKLKGFQLAVDKKAKEIREYRKKKKYSQIVTTPSLADKYTYIDFVPSNKLLSDYNKITPLEQKNYLDSILNNNLTNIDDFNHQVFSVIIQMHLNYIITKDENSKSLNEEKILYKGRWDSLCNYVKEFLGTDLTYTKEPELFDLPLDGKILSIGQSILLQFCVLLSLQDSKLEDLVIFMDEPENHLHPKALLDVINKIMNAIPNGQLWIATHSVHLLSHFEPERIWYMDEGKISHYGKSSLKVLESLVGDNERIEKMLNFMSLPGYLATNKFALECLSEPLSVMTDKNDKQVKLIYEAFKNVLIPTILDFGAGQGRLISILYELSQDENKQISELVDYYASDINPNDNCSNIIQKIYGNTTRYIVDVSNDKFLTPEYEKKFDIVLMCNVLHEIEPNYWIKIFTDIHNILKDDGLLLIVEDHLIPYGEKAYDNGFIVFDIEQFKILFRIPEEYEYKFNVPDYDSLTSDERNDARLKAHFIEKRFLNIQSEDINASLISQKEKAKNEILKLRKKCEDTGMKPDFKDGQKHGFWTQQFINCELILKSCE